MSFSPAKEHIRNIYGFDFPEDFFLFYEFAQRLADHPDLQGTYDKGLGLLNMSLMSPFRVFEPDFDPNEKDIIEDARHQADPPEFFTVLGGHTDGLHWGYYVDMPSENQPVFWVASYYSRDSYSISAGNHTLFQEARDELESSYQSYQHTLKTDQDEEELAYAAEKIKQLDIIRPILMEYETAERTETGKIYEYEYGFGNTFAERITIADTRCGMGIVAEKELYRPLPGPDMFKIWNYYPNEAMAHWLQEQAFNAIEEGFPATALKIAKDLWIYNEYNRITHEIMHAAYGALGRPILQKVLKKYCMAKSLLDDPDFQHALQTADRQTELYLTWKKISDLPADIAQFKNLKHLDLAGNELDCLPDEIGQLSQLESLDLMCNNFNTVPEVIGQLRQLKVLKLSTNGILELPDVLHQLENLEELYLANTRFWTFPKVICSFKKLKKLVITRSKFSAIPDELNQLEQLEELEIRAGTDTPIITFPKSLSNLKRLKTLKFSSYYDDDYPPFPAAFCELENLEALEIARFFDYPAAFANLQKLTYLKIGNYRLTAFPKVIFKLKNLKKLYASCCRIAALPEELGQLQALEKIHLHGNRISKIPAVLAQLPNLKHFNIGYNDLPKSEVERLKALLPNVKLTYGHQLLK